ncbi:MAG: hypothetical protein KBC56_02665 [Flavobacterium sp.]|nr:hypothetical protein [Flavobacterium sp.]
MKITELIESDLLYRDIEIRIENIKRKKNMYLILFRSSKVITFSAGAMITILTGLNITDNTITYNPGNFILIISASITLLAAIEGLFDFKDKGKNNDIILFDLRRLRDRICFDFVKGPEIYNEQKQKHFEDYQKILESQKSYLESSGGEE